MKGRVADAAALVNMESHLAKSPHDLSGGQKQRIAMAGILVDDVEILLFDEPLANLDPAAGKDAITLIDELHKNTGKTILIIEHRLEDALHCPVDRIVVMDKGRIVADEQPAAILSSGILKSSGIREPLYLSALSYAGLPITSEMKPESLDGLEVNFSRFAEWDTSLTAKDNAPCDNKSALDERANKETGLEIRDLRFRYSENNTEALKGISFSVGKGECIGLVGKNGSGKSTVAKCVCGFVKHDSGTISYNGIDLSGLSIMERARHIGFVMQNPNQMISFPLIFDEAAFGLRNRLVPENEVKARVHEALKVCGLYPFRNWPVGALSYGQKKRLTIASILTLRPSLMILDEPTAGQDYRHYTEFMEFLAGLNRSSGISLLIITHDMHLMQEYTTRTVVLSDGLCVADDEPFRILTDDDIIKKANLKRTSLYGLALKAGLPEPREFVRRFITFDREQREGKAYEKP
jgi:energy-coupling factor transport system ATP-binding protein